jgi:hypothetical protein
VIEVAGRSIGGLCSQTLRFDTGMSLEELILRQATGLGLDTPEREMAASGVMMIPIPEAGILRGVEGVAEATALPLIESVEITAALSSPLTPLPEGNSYLGFIFARGATPTLVEDALRQAHRCLRLNVSAQLPVFA